jgi:hypothetical protein
MKFLLEAHGTIITYLPEIDRPSSNEKMQAASNFEYLS